MPAAQRSEALAAWRYAGCGIAAATQGSIALVVPVALGILVLMAAIGAESRT